MCNPRSEEVKDDLWTPCILENMDAVFSYSLILEGNSYKILEPPVWLKKKKIIS